MFGELWIDRPADWAEGKAQVPSDVLPELETFVDHGFVVFEGLIDEATVEAILADKDQMFARPKNYVMKRGGAYFDPSQAEQLNRGDRVLDLFAVSKAARDAITHPKLMNFLNTAFRNTPIAMQSLYFEYGSEQAMHQDTAYVVSQEPLNLAAAWIALEDIAEGSGELTYYPGSHRFDPYLFSGEHKSWVPKRDGPEQHQAFLQGLHDQAEARGIKAQNFKAKKGDVLIWHADLAHGGSPISDPTQTRNSLVAHYVPQRVKASYKVHVPDTYHELDIASGGVMTSRHYDLRPIARGKEGRLVYNGGAAPLAQGWRGVLKRRLGLSS